MDAPHGPYGAGADLNSLKERVCGEVDQRSEVLIAAAHDIHARPELCFEEHFAHDLLTDILDGEGLEVSRHAHGLATAFTATAGTGSGPNIAVICEYDALPGLGHACGHNIIAAAGLGAGLAAAALADELGGRVVVLGTPAEEGGGGKVFMLRGGAFDGVDAALMVHPAGVDVATMHAIAIQELTVVYSGRASHAAAFPWLGRNALDAAVLGYMNVAALRQHIRADERIHGVITDGGDKPNIVPESAAAQWYVRSGSLASLELLKERVLACLEAGATASGCRLECSWRDPAYADLVGVDTLDRLYADNADRLGRTVHPREAARGFLGSTDMGNVSYEVPSIHPMIAVSPADIAIHTPEFAMWAASEAGDRAVLDGAKALAMTVVDLWTNPELVRTSRSELDRALEVRAS